MKKLVLSSALLLSIVAQAEPVHHIEIDSTVLHIIDGTPRINIPKIARFRKLVRNMHSLKAEFELNGQLYSIKDFTAHEQAGTMTEEQLKQAFDLVIEAFGKIALPYMKEAEGTEDIIKELVRQWSMQRNRPHSLLLAWSELTADAQALFYKNIKSFKDLTSFLEDLETFLGDFMKSCKKSLAQLEKATHK